MVANETNDKSNNSITIQRKKSNCEISYNFQIKSNSKYCELRTFLGRQNNVENRRAWRDSGF